MAAKAMLFHDEARSKICAGLYTLAKAVKVTLGPRGRTVVLERPYGPPSIINSGVIVAKAIELPNKFENVGAQMVREVAAKTSEMAGDGTTTATVLAEAIVQQGMRFVVAGVDPMGIKRGVDAAVETTVERLNENTRKIHSSQEVAQVGTISANGDEGIGEMIAQAMERVGRDGVIKAEDGRGMSNELEIVEGLQFDRGYLSPYFIDDLEKGRVVLEDALILLYPKQVSSITELLPVLEQVMKAARPLLIIADDVSGDALATLVINSLKGTLKSCAVKTPGFGDQRKAELEDIAIVTGTKVVTEEAGLSMDKVRVEDLGRARRVEIDKDTTVLIGGAGEKEKIAKRIAQLRQEMERASTGYERSRLEERTAKLSGGVALIKVGASTETAMREKKSRVEDAIHATRAAVEEGIGPGGGVALLRARDALENVKSANLAFQSGIDIVHRALEEPLRQIVSNAGMEADVIVETVGHGAGDFGYNAATEEYGSMMSMGVIDPTKVTRLALQNAASVAGLILTSDCVIVDLPAPMEKMPGAMPGELGI